MSGERVPVRSIWSRNRPAAVKVSFRSEAHISADGLIHVDLIMDKARVIGTNSCVCVSICVCVLATVSEQFGAISNGSI